MIASPAAKRYAKALFRLAQDEGALDAVYADILDVQRLLRESPDFAALMGNPVILPEQRDQVLRELFEGKVHALTLRFLSFLDHHRRRAAEIAGVCQVFDLLTCQAQGIQPVDVHAAHPLSEEQIGKLTTRLEKRLGGKIRLTVHDDPALLGGFRIRVHDTILDLSIASALQRVRNGILQGAAS